MLHEKGAEWEGAYVDVLKGEQFQDWYLALNPNAVVPTLVDDGRVIVESTVICEYLDDVFPDPPLKSTDPYDLAMMRIWTKRIDERLHPMTSVLTYSASHRHTILDNNTPEQVEAIIDETRDPVKRQRKREWIELGIRSAERARPSSSSRRPWPTWKRRSRARRGWRAMPIRSPMSA